MKTQLFVLFGALIAISAQAIPDTFGFFITPAGSRLEDFVNQPKVWERNAQLPGDWTNWRDDKVEDTSVILRRLNMNALVFGVKARSVVVHEKDDHVIGFDVLYIDKTGDPEKMKRQVLANLGLWSGLEIGSRGNVEYENLKIGIDQSKEDRMSLFFSLATKP